MLPLVLMSASGSRDEVGVLIITEGLYKLNSGCAMALADKENVELATEAIQGFHINAVLCVSRDCLKDADPHGTPPSGPFHLWNVIALILLFFKVNCIAFHLGFT